MGGKRIGGSTEVVKNLEQVADRSKITAFREKRKIAFEEKIIMSQIPILEDDAASKPLGSFNSVGEHLVERVICDAAIF